MKPMLSKRAQNAIKRIGEHNNYWHDMKEFKYLSLGTVIADFKWAKKYRKNLKNVGRGTLEEILEFHKLLNKVWG